jgi:hypothetical protein
MAKVEAFLQRFGGIAFGAVVAMGLASRYMILKRWADKHKPKSPEEPWPMSGANPQVPPTPTPAG